MINKKYFSLLVIGGLVGSLALTSSVFAQDATNSNPINHIGGWNGMGGDRMQNRIPGVFGTVSAINGTTITVTSKFGPKPTSTSTANTNTPITYTVDASSATVTKNGASSNVSSIVIGDNIMVQGTVTGTSVVAKTIRDGVMTKNGMQNKTEGNKNAVQSQIIQGNGQPVVAGSVTVINGSTMTITNKSNVVYTVDVTNAKIQKGNASETITNIAVGDNVVIQGTVNGTNITASSVIDQGNTTTNKVSKGFFGSIGNFFSHLFGF